MIGDFIKPESIIFELDGDNRDEILAELTEKLISLNNSLNRKDVFSALESREEKMSTLVSEGFAVPHAVSNLISETVIALGVSHNGIEFNNENGDKAKLVFAIVFPESKPEEHLEILKDILICAKDPDLINHILKSTSEIEICSLLKNAGGL